MKDLTRGHSGVLPEPGLFVIWETARHLQDRILKDLEQRFEICTVHELHWTPALVTANFQRFYSDLKLRGVYHRRNKGSGPFVVITVRDSEPVFEERETGRGRRKTIARFMDAKTRYRVWSGGIGIHCGETHWETNRDLIMLLGLEALATLTTTETDWDGSIVTQNRDVTGAHGWESLSQLFATLNRAVVYLAIHGDGPTDIDLLTEDYYALHTLLTSGRFMWAHPPNGGRMPVSIEGQQIYLGLRTLGDGYFDTRWSRRLLDTRVLDERGYYRPADNEQFDVLAYHGLVHRRNLSDEVKSSLLSKAAELGVEGWTAGALEDETRSRDLLHSLLTKRGFAHREPLDRSVFYNRRLLGLRRPFVAQAISRARNLSAVFTARLSALLKTGYWYVRDAILIRAPWLTSVKHSLRQ